jgi:hypothetical protein
VPHRRVLRFWVRCRRGARRFVWGAVYGATIAWTLAYGLVSAALVGAVTIAVAGWCLIAGEE